MTDVPSLADQDDSLKVEQDSQPEHPDAVLILKKTDEQGIKTETICLGGVQPTEVQTLIELGLQSWREKIGLSPR